MLIFLWDTLVATNVLGESAQSFGDADTFHLDEPRFFWRPITSTHQPSASPARRVVEGRAY
jgi:hypothetical protein